MESACVLIDLGPGRIQEMVAQAMHPGFDVSDAFIPVGIIQAVFFIPDDQVEAIRRDWQPARDDNPDEIGMQRG